MANCRIVCLISVAFVVLGSVSGCKEDVKRCPEAHPFAYDAGRRCCSVARGKKLEKINGKYKHVVKEWTNRWEASEATNCAGEDEYQYCNQQPERDMEEIEKPCENFKVDCTAETDCPQGYGMCVDGSCTTMCPDEMFQCKVSNLCIDKRQRCNANNDCREWYGFFWDDDSDEAEEECEWCEYGDVCSTEGETCEDLNLPDWIDEYKGHSWGVCKCVSSVCAKT